MNVRIPSTLLEDDSSLYARQPKIYPREIHGRFQRLRIAAVFWLLGMFYLFPWLQWDGRQMVLFDLPARRFHVFGLTFWPQDFYLLTLLLIAAAVSLFFFTALAGRLWCGYACPQTVWTEVFLWLERWVEGDRNKRIKLDAAPWTREKVLKKTAKQALWIGFAAWTGFTFVGFFTPIRMLAQEVATLSVGSWESFWIVFYGFATYGNAGYLREQVCKYMCPYARFQGAMFDRDTLIVSYDAARGEPRGGRKKTADLALLGLGDCVDCTACVQVCPTGIDIRDGLQYECIACAACIDACDAVMDRMNYPRGLIRYTTENMLLAGKPRRVIRTRTLIYAGILAVIVAAFLIGVFTRTPVLAEVMHDRNALFRETALGEIQNTYSARLVNKTDAAVELHVEVQAEHGIAAIDTPPLRLAPGETGQMAIALRARSGDAHGKETVRIRFVDADHHELARARSQFFAPREEEHHHEKH
jgi:cytochrome c oxidase accessory protein FixG